jgi:hypothetical protein
MKYKSTGNLNKHLKNYHSSKLELDTSVKSQPTIQEFQKLFSKRVIILGIMFKVISGSPFKGSEQIRSSVQTCQVSGQVSFGGKPNLNFFMSDAGCFYFDIGRFQVASAYDIT